MIDRLSVIRAVLLSSKRVVFPLLTPTGQLVGCISRRAILAAVRYSRSYATYQEALLLEEQVRDGRHLKPGAAQAAAAAAGGGGGGEAGRWQDHHSATLTHNAALSSSSFLEFEDNWINLRSYCDLGVITAHPTTPCRRLCMLFRRLGISHLCVTDRRHSFLGFVTRRCLIYPPSTQTQAHAQAQQPGQQPQQQTSHPPPQQPAPADGQKLEPPLEAAEEEQEEQKLPAAAAAAAATAAVSLPSLAASLRQSAAQVEQSLSRSVDRQQLQEGAEAAWEDGSDGWSLSRPQAQAGAGDDEDEDEDAGDELEEVKQPHAAAGMSGLHALPSASPAFSAPLPLSFAAQHAMHRQLLSLRSAQHQQPGS